MSLPMLGCACGADFLKGLAVRGINLSIRNIKSRDLLPFGARRGTTWECLGYFVGECYLDSMSGQT